MTSTEEILLRMGLDTTQVTKALTGVSGAIKGTIDNLKAGIASMAAGWTAGTFLSKMKESIDLAEQISLKSKALGTTTAFYQDVVNIGVASGMTDEKMQGMLRTLIKTLPAGKDVEEAFYELADKIAATEDPVKRAQLALDKFGKSGLDMIGILSGGSQALKDAAKEFDKFGDSELAQLAKADEALDKVENRMKIFFGRMAGLAVDSAQAIVKAVKNFRTPAQAPAYLADVWLENAQEAGRAKAMEDRNREIAQQAELIAKARDNIKDFQKWRDELIFKSLPLAQQEEKLLDAWYKQAGAIDELDQGTEEWVKSMKEMYKIESDLEELRKKAAKEEEKRAEQQKKQAKEVKKAKADLADTEDAIAKAQRAPGEFTLEDLAQFRFGGRGGMAARSVLQLREWAKMNNMTGNFGLAERQMSRADQIFADLKKWNPYLKDPMDELLLKAEKQAASLKTLEDLAAGRGLNVKTEED